MMRRRVGVGIAALYILVPIAGARGHGGPQFYDLGALDGPGGQSGARDVSANGEVVVGWSSSARSGRHEAFVWTLEEGLVPLGVLEDGGSPESQAESVSGDGSVIVGWSLPTGDAPTVQYVQWSARAISPLPVPAGANPPGNSNWGPFLPIFVSDDGRNMAASFADDHGYDLAGRWVDGNPELLAIPDGSDDSYVGGLSRDGHVVVGEVYSPGDHSIATYWTDGTPYSLGGYSIAAVSEDGSTFVIGGDAGWAVGEHLPGQLLAPLDGSYTGWVDFMSRDATLVFGKAGFEHPHDFGTDFVPIYWDATGDVHTVESLLVGKGLGGDIWGWTGLSVYGVSADNKILAGEAYTPGGKRHAWVADLHNRPPNDRCEYARDIREQPIVTPLLGQRRVSLGTLFDADDDGGDTCGGTGKPSAWFVFRAPIDGYLYADLCGSAIQNGVISVHAGCPGGSANQIWCASDCADALCGGPCLDPQWVPIAANQDYYIRVAGELAGANGNFTLTTQFYPENDTCDQAYYIPVNQVTDGFTTRATIDTPPVCHEQNVTAPGVWYKVIGTGSTITATTCGDADFDTKISVYCGGCLNPLCIDANDDSVDQCGLPYVSRQSTVQWCSAAGQVYHVLVHGFNDEVGSFGLDVSADSTLCGLTLNCAPPNDTCSGAIPIAREGSNLATTMLIDNNGASSGADATTCYGFEKDLWFSYIPECNGQLWVDTCQVGVGSAADTVVGVYDACGGNEIDCNDDYSDPSIDCGRRSNVIVPMYANQEVAIRVGTFPGTNAGTMPLRVTEVPGAIVFLGGNETLFQGASQVVHATVYGGCPPFVFTATDVPPGMTYASLADDFSLTGTPTVAGDYTVHVDVCSRDLFNPECASGDLHVRVLPTNDACADAVSVSEGSFAFGNTFATTDGPDEPNLCDNAGYTDVGSDVWYRYTSSCSGIATADLCDSAYDTKVAVYDGSTCPLMGSAVACNDDACGDDGLKSRVEFSVSEGESYLVRVGGYAEAQGAGRLTLTCFNDCNGNGVNDLIDNDTPEHADCNHNGRPDDCDLPGDFNGDGNLSIADYLPVYLCLSAVCPGPSCVPTLYFDDCCGRFDLDADGDVDLVDWAAYQRSFPLGHP